MKIFLISTAYEGCDTRAFSSAELAEQYLIDSENYYSDIVEVSLDGGYSDTYISTPRLDAHRAEIQKRDAELHAEFLAEYRCDVCGAGWKSCDCHAEVPCGDFGGVTKKGSACLNPVLKRAESRCHLHA